MKPRRNIVIVPSLLALALLAPAAAAATDPAAVSAAALEEEVRFETACEARGRKVERCRTAGGEIRLTCSAAHPLAAFWRWLRGREDEVRVVVVREEGEEQVAAEAAAGRRHVRVVRGSGELPACRGDV